jgi:hypothetical protein
MLLSSAVRFIFQMTCSDKSENELQLLKPGTVMQVYLNLGTVEPHIEACISCSERCYDSLNRSNIMVKKMSDEFGQDFEEDGWGLIKAAGVRAGIRTAHLWNIRTGRYR